MKVSDYIAQKFQTFGIQLSEADLLDICRPLHIILDIEDVEDLDETDHNRLMVSIARFIPSLLLHPTSMGEGGMSVSRAQREDILAFYSFLCKKYGLKDELSNKPKCTFL